MRSFLSVIALVGLFSTSALATPTKRKVAQEKISCVPLGTALAISEEDGYSVEELKMLRNSVYAQLGFKFKSPEITNEMTKRGCLKTDVVFSSDKIQKVDKQNVRLLKALENSLKDFDQMSNFQDSWDKAAGAPRTRVKLLLNNYCYLSDAKNKYFGILFFNSNKTASGNELNGMMNLEKPSWAEPMTDQERAGYLNSIAYKTLDTTTAVVLDYATKGSWTINDTRTKNLGQLQITINSDYKNVKNSIAHVSSENYKETRMLDCKLAE